MFIWKDQFETLVAERDRLRNQLVGEWNTSDALRMTNESLAEINRKLLLERDALTDRLRIVTNGTSSTALGSVSERDVRREPRGVPAKITTTVPLVGKIKSKRKKK